MSTQLSDLMLQLTVLYAQCFSMRSCCMHATASLRYLCPESARMMFTHEAVLYIATALHTLVLTLKQAAAARGLGETKLAQDDYEAAAAHLHMYLHLAQTTVKSLQLQADACKQLCALYSALAAATTSTTSSSKRASVTTELAPHMSPRKSVVGTPTAASAVAARKSSRAVAVAAAPAVVAAAVAAVSSASSSVNELNTDDDAAAAVAATGGSVTSLAYLKLVAQSRAVTYASMYRTCMTATDQ
jgi:hypothetical protein